VEVEVPAFSVNVMYFPEEGKPCQRKHHISPKKKLNHGARLACQVKVKQDMEITIPEEVFELRNGQEP